MPSAWERARSPYDVRWSHGKSGSRRETTRAAHRGVDGTGGSSATSFKGKPRGSLLVLRRERGDHRVVLVDLAQLGRAARGAEIVEEVDVGLVVVLPLLRR